MFDIYIKDFNQNGRLITTETLVQSIPSSTQGDLKLIQPIVKCEMGNAESFSFNIEGGTKFYDAFNQMKTFMRVVYDGDTIFYGRVLTISNSFYGTRSIRCEGPLAFLNDTSIEGQKEESRPSITVNWHLTNILSTHNAMCDDQRRHFNLGEVPGNYSSNVSEEQKIPNEKRKFGQDGWQDCKAAIEDLRSHYGGYLRVRCLGHRSGNSFVDGGRFLDWMNHYFNSDENTQTIEVGKNVIDISTTTEIDNIFTVVIPIGNSKTTTTETVDGEKKSTGPSHFYVDGYEVPVPSICSSKYANQLNSGYHRYEYYRDAIAKYGRIIKTVTFDDAENKDALLDKCYQWIKNNYQGEVTKFTVKAVDMHQIGDKSISKIMVGDRVRILYPIVHEDNSKEQGNVIYTCLSISYDLYNPENNAYTFGIPANILTKSYGVTKQGKSTTQASTTPKSSSGTTNTKEVDWLDKVIAWLQEHKICYRHKVNIVSTSGGTITLGMNNNYLDEQANSNMPWKESLRSHEKGPYTGLFDQGNYFISTEVAGGVGELVSNRTIWKCVPGKEESTFNQAELDKRIKDSTDAMTAAGAPSTAIEQTKASIREQYTREHPSTSTWTAYQIVLEGLPTANNIFSCNIIEYVKQEYGIDLKNNFAGVKPPSAITYTDSNGTDVTLTLTGNEYRTKEFYSPKYSPTQEDKEHGYHQLVDAEGNIIVSRLEDDGEWHYTQWDPETGTEIEISIRDLDLHIAQAADFIGSEITQGKNPMVLDEDGTPHVYRCGLGTEKWADGEVVVGKVDGDVVALGTKVTKYNSVVSQYINGQWIMPVEFYVDTAPDGTVTKKAKHGSITIGQAGSTQYIAYLSKKYDPPKYLPVPKGYLDNVWSEEEKTKWRNENMVDPRESAFTPFVGAGTWDTENLAIKGGIYTVNDDDGRPVTYVASKQLIMGDTNTRMTIRDTLVSAGLFQDENGNTITDSSLINWDDPNLDHAIYTPVLLAKSIFADTVVANNARFKTIETDYAKINNLDTHISNIDVLHTKSLSSNGNITVTKEYGYVMAPYYYLGTPGDARDLASSLWTLKIAKNSSKYHIQKQAFNDTGWVDVPNTTIDVGNAATYTATNHITTPYLYIGEEGNAYNLASKAISSASLVLSGNTYYLHFYNCDNEELDITKNNKMSFSRATSLSLAWSGGVGTITATPQNETYKFYMERGTTSVYSTYWKNVYLNEVHIVGSSEYRANDIANISVNCQDIYNSAWATASGRVAFPTANTSSNEFSFTAPHINTPGEPDRVATYRIYKTTTDNVNSYVYVKGGSMDTEIARLPIGTLYTAGQNHVTLNDPTWSAWQQQGYPTSRTVTVSTTGRPTNLSKSVELRLTGGSSFSSHKTTVYMRVGSDTGTIYAAKEVDASGEYSNGESAGKISGKSSVTLNDPTWNAISGDVGAVRTVSVSTSGRVNAQGTTENLTKSVELHLTASALTVSMRAGSDSGTVYAKTTCSDGNLAAGNIKKGVSIFGVTGTFEGTVPSGYYKDAWLVYYDGQQGRPSGKKEPHQGTLTGDRYIGIVTYDSASNANYSASWYVPASGGGGGSDDYKQIGDANSWSYASAPSTSVGWYIHQISFMSRSKSIGMDEDKEYTLYIPKSQA